MQYLLFLNSLAKKPTFVLFMPSSLCMTSRNLVKSVLKYNFIIALIQTALILILVPTYGGLALAIVMLFITQLLNTLIFVRKAIRAFNVKLWTRKIIRALLANIATLAVLYPLRLAMGGDYILLISISAVLYLLIYPTILGIFKGVERSDLERLERVTKKVPFVNKIIPFAVWYAAIFVR